MSSTLDNRTHFRNTAIPAGACSRAWSACAAAWAPYGRGWERRTHAAAARAAAAVTRGHSSADSGGSSAAQTDVEPNSGEKNIKKILYF